MRYEAQLTKEAESYLKRLDKPTRERISRESTSCRKILMFTPRH